MVDFFRRLFDTGGFVPRLNCGTWTDGLVWLHVGSDLAIWLAYVSIPLLLVWHARRLNLRAVRWIGFLFAGFILSCGFTHFADALMFYHPAYRALGLLKLVTAAVSWATVIAMVPLVPRVVGLVEGPDGPLARPAGPARPGWEKYAVAVAAAVAALLLRGMCDPVLGQR
ncbi:MAG: hypothetical protein ACRC33_00850, partial [Gemmataceae bacterium]